VKEDVLSEMRSELPILIVDDEANIRRTLRMVLEGEGLETLEAASAPDAEKLLAHTRVDLVILDVILGATGNGVDLLEKQVGKARIESLRILPSS